MGERAQIILYVPGGMACDALAIGSYVRQSGVPTGPVMGVA
jgi:hypothetical protein